VRDFLCLLTLIGLPAFIGRLAVFPQADVVDEETTEQTITSHLTWISPSVLSGPTPSGDGAMQQLARQGIQTIVSVDGARPDVEAARAAGLAYVHLPIGYDSVPTSAIAGLTRVMTERSLPVYVHCHHGRHRGPAAAVICAMIAGEIDHQRALTLLESVGTSPRYAGLWKAVEEFQPLARTTDLPELVETAPVDPLVDVMVHIDERMDKLEQALAGENEAAFASDEMNGETSLPVLLHEDLREAARLAGLEATELDATGVDRQSSVGLTHSDMPAQAGMQQTRDVLPALDSRLHGNDMTIRRSTDGCTSSRSTSSHSDWPPAFDRLMQRAVNQSAAIVQSADQSRDAIRPHLDALRETCHRCHEQFRD